ncbi:MAG: ABC transporter permease [Hyphomicrobiales bacterium]
MNGTIVGLTFRQLAGKRRTFFIFLVALLPVALAVVFRIAADEDFSVNRGEVFSRPQEWTAKVLLSNLIVATFLPLAALVFGTAALGSEIEDGTATYLLAKPIPRWQVLLSKLFVAAILTAAVIVPIVIVAGAIGIAGQPTTYHFAGQTGDVGNGYGIITGFAIAAIGGAIAYCALFVTLSVFTGRAFITGLVYVFLWEGAVTRLFSGTRVLSIRQYTFGLAERIADTDPNVFDARLGGPAAIVLLVLVTILAAWLGVRRLERFEIGETS